MTPNLGIPEQFAALRRFLRESDYTEGAILSRMGISRLSESLRMLSSSPADDLLELMIQLFLLGESVSKADVDRYLPEGALALLMEFGLIGARDDRWLANVALYPCESLYIISDRNREPELPEARAGKVFAAITPNTEEFLAMLPDRRCPAFLDLCSGTAVAALAAASRYAVEAFAYDISERSGHFAEFNRRLNHLPNVTIACGDLYRPAGRRTFDRIVAHPPYVPSLRPTLLLRDGGEDGEVLTRRIIQGLPAYLEPGGRFYGLALVAHVRGESFADRVRGWLHEAQEEFDVAVIVRKVLDPERLIFDNWAPHAQAGDLMRWQSILEKGRIEAFHYCTIILQRRAEVRPVITVTRRAGARYEPQEVEDLLTWELSARAVDDLRPMAREGIAVEARRMLEGGKWGTDEYRYRVEAPFQAVQDGPGWIAALLERCDGTRTTRELFGEVAQERPGLEYAEFADSVRDLTGASFLKTA